MSDNVLIAFIAAYVVFMVAAVVFVMYQKRSSMRVIPKNLPPTKNLLSLDPVEFDRHLCWIFSTIVEKVSFTDITAADPEAKKILVDKCISEFVAYFAPINDGIDEMYGENYLTRWVGLKMSRLVVQNKIDRIINHSMPAEEIFTVVAIPVRAARGAGI